MIEKIYNKCSQLINGKEKNDKKRENQKKENGENKNSKKKKKKKDTINENKKRIKMENFPYITMFIINVITAAVSCTTI